MGGRGGEREGCGSALSVSVCVCGPGSSEVPAELWPARTAGGAVMA